MSNDYFAKPPLLLGRGSGKGFLSHIWRMARVSLRILWQVIIPYNPRPEEPSPLPNTPADIHDGQLGQCQWIFDQAEARRDQLERKAQSVFTIIVFLVPLLASVFAYILRQLSAYMILKRWEIAILSLSAAMVLLGFISVVRALLVQNRETLFLSAIINSTDGNFIEYKKENHARGLLFCASMNTAMNDHIAQFVKGAQVLTAMAVVTMSVAAILIGVEFAHHPPSSIAQTKIVGSVEVSSMQLTSIENEIAAFKSTVTTERQRETADLERRLATLKTQITEVQSTIAALTKLTKPQPKRSTKR